MAAIHTPQARLNGRAIRKERQAQARNFLWWVGVLSAVAFFALVAGHIGLTAALRFQADSERAVAMRAM